MSWHAMPTKAPVKFDCPGTVASSENIALKVGRKLKWDPAKEQFLGDAAANALLDRKRRDPWQLPKV